MDNQDMKRLFQIREYCDRIASIVRRYGRDYDVFLSDNDYFDSISMKIMQIGELVGGLSEEFKDGTKERIPWNAIKGMRNLFAHTYITMDKKVIWNVATFEIPK